MSIHDYIIDNASGATVRSDLNNALSAIVSNNSSATEPSTTYAYQWWADSSSDTLKQRNSANNGWISILTLSTGIPAGVGTTANKLVQLNGSAELPAVSGVNLTNLPGAGNTPQFYVYDASADITLTSGTATKVTTFTSEHFDADGVFDQTNQRFTVPSGQAGKYFLSARVPLYAPSNTGTDFRVFLYKNGSLYHSGYLMSFGSNSVMRHLAPHVAMLEDASVGDYYEVYTLCTVGSGAAPRILADGNNPKFMNFFGFKIG